MQSRLGKQQAAFLASVQLAGCVNEEGALLDSVVRLSKDDKKSETSNKTYVNKMGLHIESREVAENLISDELHDIMRNNEKKPTSKKSQAKSGSI